MINPAPLSLILYAFYDVTSAGDIVSVDTYADEQVRNRAEAALSKVPHQRFLF